MARSGAACLKDKAVEEVQFQHCMFGGDRDKWTSIFFAPRGMLTSLSRVCDRSHSHAPWGRLKNGGFATALETVYPEELCDALAKAVIKFLHLAPGDPLPVTKSRGEPPPKRLRPEREAAGVQPRGQRARRLIPEFMTTVDIAGEFEATDPRCKIGHKWTPGPCFGILVPKLAVTIRVSFVQAAVEARGSSDRLPCCRLPSRGRLHDLGGAAALGANDVYIGREFRDRSGKLWAASRWANPFRVRDCADLDECLARFDAYMRSSAGLRDHLGDLEGKRLLCHCRRGAPCHGDRIISFFRDVFAASDPASSITVGVFHDPEQFAIAALRCAHPFESSDLPSPLLSSIRFRMTSSVKEVIEARCKAIEFWVGRAASLAGREAELHDQVDPEVERIIAKKRILLMGEMLAAVNFPTGKELVHYLSAGFPVVGKYPETGVFPPASRCAMFEPEDLWRRSRNARAEVAAEARGSGDPILDREVLEASLDEAAKGWLKGPIAPEVLDREIGCWVPSRRFGIRQGKKMRVIDDYAASKINDTLAASEAVDPDGLDRIGANAKAHMEAFTAAEAMVPADSPFRGLARHRDHAEARLVSRLWDLASAYRQLARSPAHRSFTIVAVWDPDQRKHVYFEQPALAFGAAASVFSFNWASAGLKEILVVLFSIGSTIFYDDFCVIEVEALAANARKVVDAVFDLLGWDLKDLEDFGPQAEPLGAVLDLRRCRDGLALLANKEARVRELVANLEEVGREGAIEGSLLPRLRGRLLFSRSLCFGRVGGNALRALGIACAAGRRRLVVDGELARALFDLRSHLLRARPREIRTEHSCAPVILSDGSFEPGPSGRAEGGIGAVLLDPRDKRFLFFRAVVRGRAMERLLAGGSKTVIFELEILPVLIARLVWAERLRGRSALYFLDNDGAKGALIAGYSPNALACELVSRVTALDLEGNSLPWYDRVPSPSNLGDNPSRGERPVAVKGWPEPEEVGAAEVLRTTLASVKLG